MEYVKKLDFLSPPITLHFKGNDSHHSIMSAILTILVYALVLSATIYYFLGFINKDSPKAYFFTRYIENAGYFPVNASSMFNYVQFVDKFDNTKLGVDFSVLRVVGVNRIYYEQYMDDPTVLENENHWIYGYCNSDSDIKGIENLIDNIVYHNAACIREYYDKEKNAYFKTGEQGFVWPSVDKGCSNPESTFYGLIIQRCDNAPIQLKRDYLGECGSKTYIDEAIKKLSFKYQIIDHYADVLNYETPFTKYFYEVSSAVTDGIYIINHLNFNPADMLTHNGFFFDNEVREPSYFFTQNEKHTIDQALLENGRSTNGCLMAVYFWMQNTLQHYERTYDRFQDFLSDVGGISSIIMTLGYYLNLLINYYITLLDMEELIINRDEINYRDTKINRKPTFIRRINQIKNPPKKLIRSPQKKFPSSIKRINNMNNIYNSNDIQNEEFDINNKNLKNQEGTITKIYFNKNHVENYGMENAKNSMSSKQFIMDKTSSINNYINKKDYSKYNTYGEEKENKEESEKSVESKNKENEENKGELPIKKQNFNWFKYMLYLISCQNNNKTIDYYENIRTSLISEENIFQNYLDIYKLLKINGIPKKDIFNIIKQ